MSLDLQHYPTLAIAQTPDKLRQLPQEKLRELSDELREYYPTNWELSSARASKVVNYLIDIGVNSGKLQAAGYADRWPADMSWTEVRSGKVTNSTILEHNNTLEKKRKNRRIKIIFTNN